jgi:hypothetical protein
MLESYGDTMRDKDNNESLDDWLNAYAKTWVKNGKLIFGRKIQNGISIPITSPITDLNEEIELNPLFEKYFYIENLLSNNLRVSLTGHEFVHPDKSPI